MAGASDAENKETTKPETQAPVKKEIQPKPPALSSTKSTFTHYSLQVAATDYTNE